MMTLYTGTADAVQEHLGRRRGTGASAAELAASQQSQDG